MISIDTKIDEFAAVSYCEGADARIHGRSRDTNPHPQGSNEHAYWLDGWSHFDEMNGGGPRIKPDFPGASDFIEPHYGHFFAVPVIEKDGKPTFGEWNRFATSQEAARAGEKLAADNGGAVVLATEMYDEADENFYEPIAILGDVPEEMLGLLA
jgi:ribosome modulation factor